VRKANPIRRKAIGRNFSFLRDKIRKYRIDIEKQEKRLSVSVLSPMKKYWGDTERKTAESKPIFVPNSFFEMRKVRAMLIIENIGEMRIWKSLPRKLKIERMKGNKGGLKDSLNTIWFT